MGPKTQEVIKVHRSVIFHTNINKEISSLNQSNLSADRTKIKINKGK